MSEIVKNELEAIAAFKELTPRSSTLTLNELNYISDKRLHKEDGSGGDMWPAVPIVLRDTGTEVPEASLPAWMQDYTIESGEYIEYEVLKNIAPTTRPAATDIIVVTYDKEMTSWVGTAFEDITEQTVDIFSFLADTYTILVNSATSEAYRVGASK